MQAPRTLQEAIVHFADADNCLRYMVDHRWPNGVVCPVCGRTDVTYLTTQRKWQCKSGHAKRQFTVKVGTIFEDSALGLDKWLPAVWIITSAKNGVSSCEIARSLGVTQKTAWFMLHRIRKAMQSGSMMKLGGNGGGEVEADETFIGGKARNMHPRNMHLSVKQRRITGTGTRTKPPSWESLSVAEKFVRWLSKAARKPPSSLGSKEACRGWRGPVYRRSALLRRFGYRLRA